MQRVTMTFDDDLMDDLDAYMRQSGHQSRSEAVRDLVRAGLLKKPEVDDPNRRCVGAAVYVYDHETRELAKRILHDHHTHDELSISSLHMGSPSDASVMPGWMHRAQGRHSSSSHRQEPQMGGSPAVLSAQSSSQARYPSPS